MDEEASRSRELEQFFRAWGDGDYAKADKIWLSILEWKQKEPSVSNMFDSMGARCWFQEEKKTNDKLDFKKILERLRQLTAKKLGANHRFVGEFDRKLAMYADGMGDPDKAAVLWGKQVQCCDKCLAAKPHEFEKTVSGSLREALSKQAHAYMKLKNYAKAEPILARGMAVSQKAGDGVNFRRCATDMIALLDATGRGAQAKQIKARYGKILRD